MGRQSLAALVLAGTEARPNGTEGRATVIFRLLDVSLERYRTRQEALRFPALQLCSGEQGQSGKKITKTDLAQAEKTGRILTDKKNNLN